MTTEPNWGPLRALLRELWNDVAVRRTIEERVDISPRTMSRWISGETEEPDRKRLGNLVEALPKHRDALLEAIRQALPDFEAPPVDSAARLLEDLPLDFWLRLVEVNSNAPYNLHFETIVNLILEQLRPSIDPERIGVQITLAQCSPPPSAELPVRSLREVLKIKTHQSLLEDVGQTYFLGTESLCGHCAARCRARVVQDIEAEGSLPVRRGANERSAAAYPIRRGSRIAGVFLASSPRTNYFTLSLQKLLQVYAQLFGMAFETEMFYTPDRIRLRPMPPEDTQHPHIADFQRRVRSLLARESSRTLAQVEAAVWRQIEEELLALPPGSD